MAKFLKQLKKVNTRQLKFFLLVITLSALLIGFSVYTVTFLLSNLDDALGTQEVRKVQPPSFEVERFEKLNLIKK